MWWETFQVEWSSTGSREQICQSHDPGSRLFQIKSGKNSTIVTVSWEGNAKTVLYTVCVIEHRAESDIGSSVLITALTHSGVQCSAYPAMPYRDILMNKNIFSRLLYQKKYWFTSHSYCSSTLLYTTLWYCYKCVLTDMVHLQPVVEYTEHLLQRNVGLEHVHTSLSQIQSVYSYAYILQSSWYIKEQGKFHRHNLSAVCDWLKVEAVYI